jgi:hypothetical protein
LEAMRVQLTTQVHLPSSELVSTVLFCSYSENCIVASGRKDHLNWAATRAVHTLYFYFSFFLHNRVRSDGGESLPYSGADSGVGRPPPPKIRKNIIFWRKIVIFHTKYPKNVRASLRSAQFF